MSINRIIIYLISSIIILLAILVTAILIKANQGGLKLGYFEKIFANELSQQFDITTNSIEMFLNYSDQRGIFVSVSNISLTSKVFDKIEIDEAIVDFNIRDIVFLNLDKQISLDADSMQLLNKKNKLTFNNIKVDRKDDSPFFILIDSAFYSVDDEKKAVYINNTTVNTQSLFISDFLSPNKLFENGKLININSDASFRGYFENNLFSDDLEKTINLELDISQSSNDYSVSIKKFSTELFDLRNDSLVLINTDITRGLIDLNFIISNKNTLDLLKSTILNREGSTDKIALFLDNKLKDGIELNLVSEINLQDTDLSKTELSTNGFFDVDIVFDDNDLPNYLKGGLKYEVKLLNFESGKASLNGKIDLTEVEAYFRQINLTKEKNRNLILNFTSELNRLSDSIIKLTSESKDFNLNGQVRITETNHIYLDQFKINNFDNVNLTLSGDLSKRELNLDISGNVIDLSQNKIKPTKKNIDYYLKKETYKIFTENVIFGGNVKVNNFEASIDKAESIIKVESKAYSGNNELSYYREKNIEEDINKIISTDITFFVNKEHPARKLLSDGEIEMSSVRDLNTLEARTNIKLNDFVLINTPASLKLLSLPSISGLVSIAEGEQGIRFGYGEINYIENQDEFRDIDAFAVSDSLGLIMEGQIDRKQKLIDMKGEISPMYLVNAIIQNLPILGPIIIGNEGEGLFSIDFNLTGNVDDPDVESNPLTIIKPRILERAIESIEANTSSP